MWFWLIVAYACTPSSNDAPAGKPVAEAAGPAAPAPVEATVDLAAGAGWGAVFWRDDKAFRRGGTELLYGPKGSATAVANPGAAEGACGSPLTGAPERAVLALPAGAKAPVPVKAPANSAALVERSAWRLDDLLPPRDAYSPATSSPDPALQRGIRVASVVKTRRRGVPPVLLASGTRDCTTVVAVLDLEAATSLAFDRIPQSCEPLAVLPADDYDGDGKREVAVYNATRVLLYRLDEPRGSIGLTRIGDWSCP